MSHSSRGCWCSLQDKTNNTLISCLPQCWFLSFSCGCSHCSVLLSEPKSPELPPARWRQRHLTAPPRCPQSRAEGRTVLYCSCWVFGSVVLIPHPLSSCPPSSVWDRLHPSSGCGHITRSCSSPQVGLDRVSLKCPQMSSCCTDLFIIYPVFTNSRPSGYVDTDIRLGFMRLTITVPLYFISPLAIKEHARSGKVHWIILLYKCSLSSQSMVLVYLYCCYTCIKIISIYFLLCTDTLLFYFSVYSHL